MILHSNSQPFLASVSSLQVWLWSTSPYDCSSHLPLIRSRVSPAESWRCICLWCQSFIVGQRWRPALTEDEEDREDCRREWRRRFLHLREPRRAEEKTRGERENRNVAFFFYLLNLQPHQLGQMVWSHSSVTETPLMPNWRRYDKTRDISDARREAALWKTADPRTRRLKPLWTLKFFFPPCFYENGPGWMCVCHFKVLLCLHTWACEFFVLFFIFLCGGDAPNPHHSPVWSRMNAVWLTSDLFTVLQCGCSRVPECQNYTARRALSFLLCFLCYRVLLLDRAQPDSGLVHLCSGIRNRLQICDDAQLS